jgi:hypothetical protein
MSIRVALVSGTVLSLAAVAAWSWTADLTIGAPSPLRLTRNPVTDYARLAGAPTGNSWELFAAVAVIYALCLLASGWRLYRRRTGGGA